MAAKGTSHDATLARRARRGTCDRTRRAAPEMRESPSMIADGLFLALAAEFGERSGPE